MIENPKTLCRQATAGGLNDPKLSLFGRACRAWRRSNDVSLSGMAELMRISAFDLAAAEVGDIPVDPAWAKNLPAVMQEALFAHLIEWHETRIAELRRAMPGHNALAGAAEGELPPRVSTKDRLDLRVLVDGQRRMPRAPLRPDGLGHSGVTVAL